MRVCIVGQGPTAEGQGEMIDSCDFVVRIKAFWRYGAERAGERTDAVAWFGTQRDVWAHRPKLVVWPKCEHWLTWSDEQFQVSGSEWAEAHWFFRSTAREYPIRQLSSRKWREAVSFLPAHPSTGFAAVLMALDRWSACKLVLTGFDSLTPDLPDYLDARSIPDPFIADHDMLAEKRALLHIQDGRFLGKPCSATLEWHNPPEIPDGDIGPSKLERLIRGTDHGCNDGPRAGGGRDPGP